MTATSYGEATPKRAWFRSAKAGGSGLGARKSYTKRIEKNNRRTGRARAGPFNQRNPRPVNSIREIRVP
jgi:hypothetical protein